MKTHRQLTAIFHRQPGEPFLTLKRILGHVNLTNFPRAIVALILWGSIICVLTVAYEVWRLGNNWRLGIAR